MPQIRYNPTTNGSTFGDTSDIFKAASQNLNNAFSGAESAASKFGAIQKKETDELTSVANQQIQGIKTVEDRDNFFASIESAGGIGQLYQGADVNQLQQALSNVDKNIRTEDLRIRDEGVADNAFTEQQRVLQQGVNVREAGTVAQGLGQDIAALSKARDGAGTAAEAKVFQNRINTIQEQNLRQTEIDNANFEQEKNVNTRLLDNLLDQGINSIGESVPGQGDITTFKQKETGIEDLVNSLRNNPDNTFSTTQINNLENQLKTNLGINDEAKLERIFNQLTLKEGKLDKTEFYKVAEENGIPLGLVDNRILQQNIRSEKTKRDAEKLRQDLRKEKHEDEKRSLELKSYSDINVYKAIDDTFDDGSGFFAQLLSGGLLALDRRDARTYYQLAKDAGMTNKQAYNLVIGSNDGTGDFLESTGDLFLKKFKKGKSLTPAEKALQEKFERIKAASTVKRNSEEFLNNVYSQ